LESHIQNAEISIHQILQESDRRWAWWFHVISHICALYTLYRDSVYITI